MTNKRKNGGSIFPWAALIFLLLLAAGCAPVSRVVPADYVDPITMMEFVFVKGGKFEMGDRTQQTQRELPIHTVGVPDMAVSLYEVTFAQYDSFCEETGREKPSDEGWGRGNRPVMNVSWHDANAFAQWLRRELKLNFNLPTEAQWEYFARAGTTTRFWTGNTLPINNANCSECGSEFDNRMTAPVGSFKPNPWGLYDTAGNLAEWTLDDWQPGYKDVPDDGSAWLNGSTGEKVYRGGAWDYPLKGLQSATRDWAKSSDAYSTIGFRLVINGFTTPQTK